MGNKRKVYAMRRHSRSLSTQKQPKILIYTHSGEAGAMHLCMLLTDVLVSSQIKPEQRECARLQRIRVCRFTRLTRWCHIEQTWTDNEESS